MFDGRRSESGHSRRGCSRSIRSSARRCAYGYHMIRWSPRAIRLVRLARLRRSAATGRAFAATSSAYVVVVAIVIPEIYLDVQATQAGVGELAKVLRRQVVA